MENTNTTAEYTAVEVNVKSLLDAGAHFGHKSERWNPKMLPYIFGQRNNIHIINLDLTIQSWKRARQYITDIASRGGSFLFVGTKEQAKRLIETSSARAGIHYVNNRWLGGTLSNFRTIKNSISRMEKLEELTVKAGIPDSEVKIAKKERLALARQIEKLNSNLCGIRTMKKLPDVVFVVDINKDSIAVEEARKLHIPVVALVDTNGDPDKVDFAIPSNDDAAGAIELFTNAVADAVIEGRAIYQQRLEDNSAAKQQKQQQQQEAVSN